MKKGIQPVRVALHVNTGLLAILIYQVLGMAPEGVRGIIAQVAGYLLGGEVLKMFVYHLLVKDGAKWALALDPAFWKERKSREGRVVCFMLSCVVRFLRWLHLVIVEWFFVKTKMIRADDIKLYSAMFPFAAGIFIPLYLGGVGLAAMMLAIVLHAFGDPMARIFGVLWGEGHEILPEGKKTWPGFIGFVFGAVAGGLVSVILNIWFPIYERSDVVVLVIVLVSPVGALLEFLSEPSDRLVQGFGKEAKYIGHVVTFLTRDNFLVTCVLAFFANFILGCF